MIQCLITIVILVLTMVAAPLQAANFKALLIGINYKGADKLIPPLNGAVDDAETLHSLMTGSLGIPRNRIHMLIESQATRAAILGEIKDWLIEDSAPGDEIFLMFAGHGLQVPDQSGQQHQDPDRQHRPAKEANLDLAEALVPYDTRINERNQELTNLIVDSELHQLLIQLTGRRVTLWLDSCHSGGATRSFSLGNFKPRRVTLPKNWDVNSTKLSTTDAEFNTRATTRGLIRVRENQGLPYNYFAAARYFQLAHETGGHGMFTQALAELLQANPQANYTNAQILTVVRDFLQNRMRMPKETQEPVFYGSPTAADEEFPLFSARNLIHTSMVAEPPPYKSVATTTITRVAIQGSGRLVTALTSAIRKNSAQLAVDAQHPDLVVLVKGKNVELYHPAGQLLQKLPDKVALVMDAILGYHTGQRLGNIHNLAAPFQVDLWLDKRGKTKFSRNGGDVTLYYRVEELPYAQAYLTLLNLAPNGSLSVLYPQPERAAATDAPRLYLNAPVVPGRTHSIPRSKEDLKPGEPIGYDLYIRFNQTGTEYFKALVTPEPLDLSSADAQLMLGGLKATGGADFAARLNDMVEAMAAKLAPNGWGTGDLQVVVK